MTTLTHLLARLWRTDARLTGASLLMAVLLLPLLAGLWLDPRMVTGAPVWLKPTKFAASTAILMLTLAWVFTFLPEWPRLRRTVSRVTAWVFVIEVGIIIVQAWRGTASHFNVSTALDGVLFGIMGTGILIQTLASSAVAVALWRQPFTDQVMGWALRWGMTLSIAGALTGGLMTQPTAAQIREAESTGRMTTAGAHTVGAPDGGPGLPLTGWSTRAGDLRVPHFVGLHALQVLPLLVAVSRRTMARPVSSRGVITAAALYALAFVLLLVQALNGRPLITLG